MGAVKTKRDKTQLYAFLTKSSYKKLKKNSFFFIQKNRLYL